MRWPLQPLLELRRREAEAAERALGEAVARLRATGDEALAARGAAASGREATRLTRPVHWVARLGRDAARLQALAVEADQRCRVEAAAVERAQAKLREAAAGRDLLRRLRDTWREEQALVAARRAEAALDDRPWPGRASWPALKP